MHRRNFLQFAALGSAGLLLPVGRSAWAAVGNPASGMQRRLIVVLLRGAVDGLSVVVPYADPGYARARSSIALGLPGDDGGALDLDGRFGLHPELSPLMPFWQARTLGFVHATGSPDATRSHFDAQDYMESATPGHKNTPDGWLNRLLGILPADPAGRVAATRAISVGPVLPRIYAGPNAVANIASGAAATRPTLLDRPQIAAGFNRLYQGDDKLARAYQDSQAAHQEVMASMEGSDLTREMEAANNGAPLPNGFPDDAARLAALIRKDNRVQLAFMAVGGWDTHANQGAAKGQLANRLAPLGQGLAALANGLGPDLANTAILVMSEFGRTVRQNGNGGTDHGHGNVMWLLGGTVAGGKVHGEWPGLEDRALYEGRDLAVSTDFRDVLVQASAQHLRLPDGKLNRVFPDFRPNAGRLALFKA